MINVGYRWFCLFIYLRVLTFPLEDCSEFGNFVITLIYMSSSYFSQILDDAQKPRKTLFYEYLRGIIPELYESQRTQHQAFNCILPI
jgi:hypothetical protein